MLLERGLKVLTYDRHGALYIVYIRILIVEIELSKVPTEIYVKQKSSATLAFSYKFDGNSLLCLNMTT